MLNVDKGERVRLSGDAAELWIADYNVRVDSYATVMETPAPRAKKVLVTIDSIDGDSNVTTYVRRSRVIPLPGSYPDFFPGGAERYAKRCADKVCEHGMCRAPYNCQCEDHGKGPWRTFRMIGTETVCPLEKYQPDAIDLPPDDRHKRPTQQELTAVCALCPHGHVTITDGALQVDFADLDTACVDCPIQSVIDVLRETKAEASMS